MGVESVFDGFDDDSPADDARFCAETIPGTTKAPASTTSRNNLNVMAPAPGCDCVHWLVFLRLNSWKLRQRYRPHQYLCLGRGLAVVAAATSVVVLVAIVSAVIVLLAAIALAVGQGAVIVATIVVVATIAIAVTVRSRFRS